MRTVTYEVSRRGLQGVLAAAAAGTLLLSQSDSPFVFAAALLLALSVCPGYAVSVLVGRVTGVPVPDNRPGRVAEAVVLSVATLMLVGGALAVLGLDLSLAPLAVASLLVAATLFVPDGSRRLSLPHRELLTWTLLLTVGVVAISTPALLSVRSAVGFHGGLHLAIVQSVLETGIPAASPDFAWRSIAFYWPYHLLVATASVLTGGHPIVVMWTFNAVALATVLYFIVQAVALLSDGDRHVVLFPSLLALGGLNAVAPFVFALRYSGLLYAVVRFGPVRDVLTVVLPAIPSSLASYDFLLSRLSPAYDPSGFLYGYTNMLWDGRLSSSLSNYLGNSSFGLGVALAAVLLYLFLAGGQARSARRGALFAVATVTLFHLHVLAAFFTIISFGLASLVRLVDFDDLRPDTGAIRHWTAVWTLGGAACLPMFVHLRTVGESSSQLRLGVWLSDLFGVVVMFLLVGPLLVAGFRRLRVDAPEDALALGVLCAAFAAFPLVADVPDDNNYKSFFLLVLPAAVVGTLGVQRLRARFGGRARTALAVILVLALLANPLMFFSLGWPTQSTYVSNHQYELDGTRLALADDAPYSDAPFAHVAANAAPDAAIVVDPIVFDRLIDGEGGESTLFGAAMTERNHFYGGRYPHYITYADRDQRNATRRAVLDCEPEAIHDAAQSEVYVVVDSTREDCALGATLTDHPHWTRVAADGDLRVFRHPAVDA